MIGIIGAMDVEVATLRENMHNAQTVRQAGMTFYKGVTIFDIIIGFIGLVLIAIAFSSNLAFRALIGGAIFVVFVPLYITINGDRLYLVVAYFFKHLDYCLEKFGDSNIAFGCDIDGVDGNYLPSLDISRSIHDQLVEYLQKHYSESIVEKVAGANYLNFLKNNL